MTLFKRHKYTDLSPTNPLLILFNYLLLIALTVAVIAPMFVVFIVSFKTNKEYITTDFIQLPASFFNFENYRIIIQEAGLITGFKNTLVLVVCPTIVTVLFGTQVAYVVTRFNFKLKKVILGLFVFAALIPQMTIQIAQFTVVSGLGLFNSIYAGLLIYSAAGVIEVYIFIQHMEKIPRTLDESALVAGASYPRIYWSIILPLMKPAIATVVILRVLFIYNDMVMPYLLMPKDSLKTIVTAFLSYSYDNVSQWNIMGAGIVVILIPAVTIYFFIQRFIFSGITSGAVKE